MRFTTLLCVGLIAFAQSVIATIPEIGDEREGGLYAQHLWDEELHLPEDRGEAPIEEAQLIDLPPVSEHEMIATHWWEFNGRDFEILNLSQHLWDEEWSAPKEESQTDELRLMELPPVNEDEMIATHWWDFNNYGVETLDLSQHLWDEEWSEPREESQRDELQLMELPPVSENEMIATHWWDFNNNGVETLDLSQHLWDEEWSEPSEESQSGEFRLIELPPVSEDEMIATHWWDFDWQANETVDLAQHLWDEEWSTGGDYGEIEVNEAFLIDAHSVEETETVAGFWWKYDDKELEMLSQHLWDEEWFSSPEGEVNRAGEASQNLPEVNEREVVASFWWEYDVPNKRQDLVAQHLWDEEWSVPSEVLRFELNEVKQTDPELAEKSETAAA